MTTDADLWFSLPPVFHELPLYDDESRAASTRLREAALAFAAGAPTEQQQGLLASLDMALGALRDQGAHYWGVALVRSPDDSLSTANLTVMVRQIPPGATRRQSVGAIAATLGAGPNSTVALRDLPAGPAAVVTRETTQPLGSFGESPKQAVKVRDVQYVIPFPDSERIAVFELSTMYLPDWNDYLRVMEGIVHSISFTDPDLIARQVSEADRIRAIIAGES